MLDLYEHTDKYSSKNYSPLKLALAKGRGAKVWDIEDNCYIDCISGFSVVNQGHCHPKIIKAFQEQSQKITMVSRALYSDNLGKWGADIKNIDESSSEIIAMNGNFHGRTLGSLSLSSQDSYKKGFGPLLNNIHYADFGDIEQLKKLINNQTTAIILEPIQGEGGVNIPPTHFIQEVRQLCNEYNVLLIADEIQVGLGRTGKMFAMEWENTEPDIYLLGKSLGGGLYPISAVLANQDVMSVLTPGTHGSTFGGNPLACAVSMAALDVLNEEHLVQNALDLGDRLLKHLQQIESELIVEVRGRGLFIGIELNVAAQDYCEQMINKGVLCKETQGNIIRITPPLVIDKDEIDEVIRVITDVLEK